MGRTSTVCKGKYLLLDVLLSFFGGGGLIKHTFALQPEIKLGEEN